MKSSHFSLKELKTYMENSRLEVKSARGGLPNSLWESYSVFANSDGGVIVLHVPRAERTSRPVYVGADPRTGTYRRNGEGDYHCTIEEPYVLRESVVVYGSNDTVSDTVNEFADNIGGDDTVSDTVNINIDTVN